MEGLLPRTPFAKFVSGKLNGDRFTLIDVGCGGGIDRAWRSFGDNLRALCFDPNIAEVERLAAKEKLSTVSYFPSFVGVPDDHPLARSSADHGFWGRNPWNRFSVNRTYQLQQQSISKLSDVEKVEVNAWRETKLADGPAIYLPDLLAERSVTDVDFVKIDVDGPDYLILQSLEETLADSGVLGVGIEVNFYGSADPRENTFHNVDRYMRSIGFDLFSLSTRSYSMQALPAPYLLTIPAQATFGRPYQGDALYLRDLGSPDFVDIADKMPVAKLAKLAAICSLAGLPDCAADILVKFRGRLASFFDVDEALDLLVAQTSLGVARNLNYRDYLNLFEQNDAAFYPSVSGGAQAANSGGSIPVSQGVPEKKDKRKGWRKKFRRLTKMLGLRKERI